MKIVYSCSKCGAQFPKWSGRCSECSSWGTLEKEVITNSEKKEKENILKDVKIDFIDLSKISNSENQKLKTDFDSFDIAIGGGIVKGSLVLLGGEPGIGKSTIISQILSDKFKTLYISGEETASSVKSRIDRLNIKVKNLQFLAENSLEVILSASLKSKPDLLIVDSIQTIYTGDIDSDAGGVSQVRACTVKLMEIARKLNMAILIVSHVNKSGDLAGPKALEHLVDCVVSLEGDRLNRYRMLRIIKNRYGSTDNSEVLEMTKTGFKKVINPSNIYLSSLKGETKGTIITSIVDGNQVLMLELQALINKTNFGYPKRTTSGFDQKRLELLLAVLSTRADMNLGSYDIYINLTGGFKVNDRSLDLSVAMAIMSAYYDKNTKESTIVFGELGLSGEVRSVPKTKERIKEAIALGFKNIIVSKFDKKIDVKGVNLIEVENIKDLEKYLVK
ncbi:MAG: DNA repair protein RadA [Patescibacteria group bacterium]|nr:DNA repair protein RadA [Patescibacteria group bacterium]MDD4304776.1 DNA repair protein RadA [Patescibacteria group bacterium]MDD4695485.1 DNA repair protein RadA [Patescibacteria group bacterium]